MRFIVDCMLGKLAKWLKILGFDTLYFSKIEDESFLKLAAQERRIILTRDTGLIEKSGQVKHLFITSENWYEQIQQVLAAFDLWDKVKPNSRCLECNVEMKTLSRKSAKNLVAPFIYEHARSFAICPQCGRVYWQGTHSQEMEAKIKQILDKKNKRETSKRKG